MALLNFTFQEASPLITYSGLWTEGSASNDTLSASYNGSFRVTQDGGASASFTFVGTAVSIFGATRPNHGNYTVQIDQLPQFAGVGATPNNHFNKSLWHADNLGYSQHTVTLTNVPAATGPFLDLDFISIERQIGQPGDDIFQAALDDTSPSVSFEGSWEATTGVSSAYQGTLHSTKTANSRAVVTFQGCCVEIYGQYANAIYTVTLDGQPPLLMQGLDVDLAPNFQHPQTLLYLVDGLSENSNHNVTLTNSNSNENRPFFIDYAVVSSTHQLNSTTAPAGVQDPTAAPTVTNPSDVRKDNANSSPTGAIVGGVVGGLVVFLLFGVAILIFIRRRRRRRHAERSFPLDLMEAYVEPKPYIIHRDPWPDSEAYGQDPFQDPVLPPGAQAGPPNPPPKFRTQVSQASSYHSSEYNSSEGPLSPQGQLEAPGPGPYGQRASTTSAAESTTVSPRSMSTSRRDAKSQYSHYEQGAGESSQRRTTQEQDAGSVVLESGAVPMSASLPPAYKPEWDREQP